MLEYNDGNNGPFRIHMTVNESFCARNDNKRDAHARVCVYVCIRKLWAIICSNVARVHHRPTHAKRKFADLIRMKHDEPTLCGTSKRLFARQHNSRFYAMWYAATFAAQMNSCNFIQSANRFAYIAYGIKQLAAPRKVKWRENDFITVDRGNWNVYSLVGCRGWSRVGFRTHCTAAKPRRMSMLPMTKTV